ncbi:AAA family ATPase [Fibrobacter sp. UWB11]|uniref:AAA family ATPase n=1 Tax=Fibrobacter sp. UWB11 TaxID=1896202 RepID=UPI00092A4461|nr:AAA family ATPase [Fibrobacter sp. UWB11]SIO32194.1 AAA ATPase domain-containing protein [Fibrobacter sp. UWB11]
MFSIDCIEVLRNCDPILRKNVVPGKFYFNDRYKEDCSEKNPNSLINKQPDFFEKNINIQAIVGKNGSGKSTLLDLVLMAINNFSYMFERGNERPGADELLYVDGLYVDLFFSIDYEEYERTACLCCHGKDEIKLTMDALKIETLGVEFSGFEKKFAIDEIERNVAEKTDEQKGLKNSEIAKLATRFFYTIVSNYSMQSYISSNYRRNVFRFFCKQKEDSCVADDRSIGEECWIDPIFHKNDGYIRSAVLNPYRHEGTVNLAREMFLSKERLTALLIYGEKAGKTIFVPYHFKSMKIAKNKKIEKKFKEYFEKMYLIYLTTYDSVDGMPIRFQRPQTELELEEWTGKKTERSQKLEKIRAMLTSSRSIFYSEIVSIYNLTTLTQAAKESILYITLKILKIVDIYPFYQKYKASFEFDKEQFIFIKKDSALFKEMMDKITTDNSHITKKIRRTINYIKVYDCCLPEEIDDIFFKTKVTSNSLNDVDDCLPPPFFDYELYVNKVENGEKVNDKPIPYNQLSSGEIQLLQTLSIHAYHIGNLLSVPNGRIQYKNINLIFDELEVCLHPEYQCQFIYRLVEMLKALRKDDESIYFNVIIITHSPFVLSDIPLKQILFLEDGMQKNKKLKTFGGNVGEMLYDSFFMDSTIGKFAEEKIKEIVRCIYNGVLSKEDTVVKDVFNCIGDPVLKTLACEVRKRND